jgi:cytoskeletal protein RodZ
MRILTLTVIAGLPLMALGQTEPQQTTQGQTNETQTTAPTKGKKMRPEQEEAKQAKPETGTNVKGRAAEINRNQPGTRSSTSQTNVKATSQTSATGASQTTTVNKQEFRSHHSEVFSLGRHPKDFFVQRFGDRHFRMIGNGYFVFVDGCWVAVDVDGFAYTERVICAGDPEFVEID